MIHQGLAEMSPHIGDAVVIIVLISVVSDAITIEVSDESRGNKSCRRNAITVIVFIRVVATIVVSIECL